MSVARKIITFLLLSAVLYIGSVFLLARISLGTYPVIYGLSDGLNLKGGNSFQKFQELDPHAKWDVIVVGSSHAYRGYDPRIFGTEGFNMFNLGSSSQTPYNSYHLIQELVDSNNCGLLVMDVFHVAFQMDGLESSSDLIANVESDQLAFKLAAGHQDPRALNMFTVRMLTGDQDAFYTDSAYIGRGFSENWNRADLDTEYPEDGAFTPQTRQAVYFLKTLELCKSKGVDVVLVDHPLPQQMRGTRLNEANAWIAEQAELQGIPFIDFSRAKGFSSRVHYYDHTHLNQIGVVRFNEMLIRELMARGLLVSR